MLKQILTFLGLKFEDPELEQWKALVYKIAKGSYTKEEKTDAYNYLFKKGEDNFLKLKNTKEGLFLRELYSPSPDILLKNMYRKDLLK